MDSAKNSQELSEQHQIESSSISLSLSSPTKEALNDSTNNNTTTTNTPSSIELPDLDENGYLNWSEKQLTKILPKEEKCAELFKLKKQILILNISKNSLRSFDCSLLPLENCFEIDASQNEFTTTQLQQFLPLIQSLLKLNLADNRINSLASLNNFINIEWLNLSHNRIETFPILDNLHHLSTLVLNCNRLRAIPNLSKLEVLSNLGLHGNLIRSFENINSLLPSNNIRFLDLGGNLVEDLCQINFLRGFTNLESLTLLGNNFSSSDEFKFSYRPFVYSCILGELKILDGVCLSEGEVIKGEWLHSSGKTRAFHPGSSHLQLCSFLSIECPLVSIEMPMMMVDGVDEGKLKKVVQKRREYNHQNLTNNYHSTPSLLFEKRRQLSTTLSPINPPPTPSSTTSTSRGKGTTIIKNINEKTKNWRINTIVKSNDKEEEEKNKTTTTIYTPTSISASAAKTCITAQILTPKTTKKDEKEINRLENNTNATGTTIVHPSKNLSKFGILRSASIHSPQTTKTSRLTTATTNSSKVCQVVRNATFSHHPTPPTSQNLLLKNTKLPILDKTAEKKKSKGGGCFRSVLAQKLRRRSNNTAQPTNQEQQPRIQLLQKRIDKLDEQNAMLLEIGEDNVKTLQQLAEKLEQVENVLSGQINQNRKFQDLLLPTPMHLTHKQVEGTNNVLVSWENTIPILNSIDHYDVFVNEQQVGKVVARNKRLLITDMNPLEDLRVSIQACFSKLNDARSQKAEIILHANKEDENGEDSPDEKENNEKRTL